MASRNSASGLASRYANLQQLPAIFSGVFVICSLYALGAISGFSINWFVDYTITTEHATFATLGAFGIAFLSSETKSFEYYETSEKVAIAAAPASMAAWQWVDQFQNWMTSLGEPTGAVIVFVVGIIGWMVAVQ